MDFVTIRAGDGCSSAVGKWGGKQLLTLDNDCFSDKIIAHELIHALGFWHEQNRPDRDQYVTIQEEFIKQDKVHNFVKRKNTITFGLPYDGLSMMHYQSYYFSIDQNDPTKKTIVSKAKRLTFLFVLRGS